MVTEREREAVFPVARDISMESFTYQDRVLKFDSVVLVRSSAENRILFTEPCVTHQTVSAFCTSLSFFSLFGLIPRCNELQQTLSVPNTCSPVARSMTHEEPSSLQFFPC